MAMKRYKLVVSDFHIGGGEFLANGSLNYLEDFHHDDLFADFLNYHCTGDFEKAEVELICNGDFYNQLHVFPDEAEADMLTESLGVRRMKAIFTGHPAITQAMKAFANTPNHRITFMLGNHDPAFLWPGVRDLMKETFGPETQVRLESYIFDGIHVEHGHRFFTDSAFDTQRYFLSKNLPEPIINLPWGSLFVIHYLGEIKKERPYFDKIHPHRYYLRWALLHDTSFAIRAMAKVVIYFLWLRFSRSPKRRSPLKNTLQIIRETTFNQTLDKPAKRILLTNKDIHCVVMGHIHKPCRKEVAPGKFYVNTGLWNEQVGLDPQYIGKTFRFTYAFVDYNGSKTPNVLLRRWRGRYRIYHDIY